MNHTRRGLVALAAVALATMFPATALGDGVSVAPTTLDYGDVPMNVSAFRTVTVTNPGPSPVTIQGAQVVAGQFGIAGGMGWPNTCHDVGASTRTLQPGESCEFDTSWNPGLLGAWDGTWEVDTSSGPIALPVTGFGTGASWSDPGPVTFDRYVLDPVEKTIRIDASGNADLHIGSVGLGDSPGTASASTPTYAITSDDCSGETLAPGQRCAVKVLLSGSVNADSALWIFSDSYTDGGWPGHAGVGAVLLDSTSSPKLAVTSSALSTTRFSPRGRDGLPASVAYSFRLTDPGTDTVQVMNANGRVIRSWVLADSAQGSVRWGGRNTSGRRVPPGRYTIHVSARFLGHTIVGGTTIVHIAT